MEELRRSAPTVESVAARWGTVLFVFPAGCAVTNVVVQVYLTTYGMFEPGSWDDLTPVDTVEAVGDAVFSVLITAYSLAAPLLLAVLVVATLRRYPRAMPVATAACLAFTAATVWMLVSMLRDESSTAVLLLLFLPIYLIALLVPFALVTVLVGRVRRRSPVR